MNFKFRLSVVLVLSIAAALMIINACRKISSGKNRQPTPITFEVPEGFPAPVYNFADNPLTEEGFELGRKLFHDHTISKNLDVTCSSCHQQEPDIPHSIMTSVMEPITSIRFAMFREFSIWCGSMNFSGTGVYQVFANRLSVA